MSIFISPYGSPNTSSTSLYKSAAGFAIPNLGIRFVKAEAPSPNICSAVDPKYESIPNFKSLSLAAAPRLMRLLIMGEYAPLAWKAFTTCSAWPKTPPYLGHPIPRFTRLDKVWKGLENCVPCAGAKAQPKLPGTGTYPPSSAVSKNFRVPLSKKGVLV